MTPIGIKIKELRKINRLNQSQIAEVLGYDSPSLVTRLETGKTELTVRQMIKLCKFFRISYDEFLDENKPVTPKNIIKFREVEDLEN